MDRVSIKVREEEIVLGILQFLRKRGYLESFLKLEEESGMHLEQNCREIEFFRSLIIDGQFKEAEVFLELFKPIPMFPYKQCLFELKKQQFFELLELNDDQDQQVVAILKELQEIASKQEYKQLTSVLALKHITDCPDYAHWNPLRGRLDCFEFVKEYLEVIYLPPKEPGVPYLINTLLNEAFTLKFQDTLNVQYIKSLKGEVSLFDQRLFGKNIDNGRKSIDIIMQSPNKKRDIEQLQSSWLRPSDLVSGPETLEIVRQSLNIENLKKNFGNFDELGTIKKKLSNEPLETIDKLAKSLSCEINSLERIASKEDSRSPTSFNSLNRVSENMNRNKLREITSSYINQEKVLSIEKIERFGTEQKSPELFSENEPQNIRNSQRVSRALLEPNKDYCGSEEVTPGGTLKSYSKTETFCDEVYQDFREIYSIKDSNPIRAACFNNDGNAFAIGTNSKSLKIYSFSPNSDKENEGVAKMVWEKQNHHIGSIYAIDWSKSNQFIATGSNDKTIKIISLPDIDNATDFLELKLLGHKGIIRSLCFSANSRDLYSACTDHLIKIWDVERGTEKSTLEGHTNAVYCIQVSPDNTYCVSVGTDRALKVWDLRSAKRSLSIDTKEFSEMNYVSLSEGVNNFSATNKSLDIEMRVAAIAHTDGLVTLWDLAYPKAPKEVKIHSEDCRSVEFDSKSNYLLTASFDNTIGIYDLANRTLKEKLTSHSDRVVLAKWHPNLPVILSASADCTARIYAPKKLLEAL